MSTFQIWAYPNTVSEEVLAQQLVAVTQEHADMLQYTNDLSRFASVEKTGLWLREPAEEGLRRRMFFPFYDTAGSEKIAGIVWYTRSLCESAGWSNRSDSLSMAVRNYRLPWNQLRGTEMISAAEKDLLRIYEILGWRVKEILLEVDTESAAAIACYEKVGFTGNRQLGNGKIQMRKKPNPQSEWLVTPPC